MRYLRGTPAERLAHAVEKRDGGCWIWTGGVTTDGYGNIGHPRGVTLPRSTHRLAWTLARGPIPDGLWVLHRCDVRRCVNPEHLFLGTRVDNVRDMYSKGRWKYTKPLATHCQRGHAFTPDNTYIRPNKGTRVCIECRRAAARRRAARQRVTS